MLLRSAAILAMWLLAVALRPATATGQTGVEQELLADAADGRLDRFDLLDAVLIAGGTDDPQRRGSYRNELRRLGDQLAVSGRVTGSELDRARAIHEFLHARLFTGGFREQATTLDEAFDAGRFNCTSSVVLFVLLAERFQLRTHALEVPGHAYAVVETSGGPLVVQTTCRDWFAVLDDDGSRRAALRRTLGDRSADADLGATSGRRLSDVALTAVVFYNRGLDHLEAGRFAESSAADRAALRLDPHNVAARANLLATLNNWSLDCCRRGDVAQAVRLLESGLAIAPDYRLFHENLAAVRRQASRGL